MTALPGTPQIQNAIQCLFLKQMHLYTLIGLIGSGVMFGVGLVSFYKRAEEAMATVKGYGNHNEEIIGDFSLSKCT